MLVETITLCALALPRQGHHRKSTHPDRPRPAAPPGHRRGKKRRQVKRANDFDPWIEGYEARQARLARAANPYSRPDSQHLWDDGWMEAHRQGAP